MRVIISYFRLVACKYQFFNKYNLKKIKLLYFMYIINKKINIIMIIKLTSLVAVGGSSRRLDINGTSKLEVKGLYNDGTEKEITENITWESENESIVTVDNNGTITAKEYGSTIVSAMINHVNSAKFYIFVDKY